MTRLPISVNVRLSVNAHNRFAHINFAYTLFVCYDYRSLNPHMYTPLRSPNTIYPWNTPYIYVFYFMSNTMHYTMHVTMHYTMHFTYTQPTTTSILPLRTTLLFVVCL